MTWMGNRSMSPISPSAVQSRYLQRSHEGQRRWRTRVCCFTGSSPADDGCQLGWTLSIQLIRFIFITSSPFYPKSPAMHYLCRRDTILNFALTTSIIYRPSVFAVSLANHDICLETFNKVLTAWKVIVLLFSRRQAAGSVQTFPTHGLCVVAPYCSLFLFNAQTSMNV